MEKPETQVINSGYELFGWKQTGLVDLNMVRHLLFIFQIWCFQGEWELYFTDSENQHSALVTFLMVEYTYGPWKHTSDGQIIHYSSVKPECMDLV